LASKKTYSFQDCLIEIAKISRSSPKPVLINIAGGSCSGKTYFSKELCEEIKKFNLLSSIIGLDYYFKDIDDPLLPKNSEGKRLFDVPESYRQIKFVQDVMKLINLKAIYMPDYNISTNKIISDKGRILSSNKIIIAEGLFAIRFLKGIHPNLINVYIDVSEKTCLERRVKRDVELYNFSPEKSRLYWQKKVMPNFHKFVKPQKKFADFIIKE